MLATLGYGVASFVIAFVLAALLGSDGGALSKEFPWQFRLAAACRTPVLMLIVVPLSFIRGKYTLARRRLRRYLRGPGGKAAAIRHAAHVDSISEQLRAWDRGGRKRKLRTARSNWAAMSTKLGSNKEECNQIALGHMNEILDVDEDGLTLTCEPGVTMGELTDELLPLGLMLQSHIEMESITIGGLAMGFGIETNSHKVGFFQESVLEYEFVDSHGRRHSVTKDQPELFYALPWSYGTIGFLTSLKVKLLRTQPYVRVEYLPTSSAQELTSQLQRLAALGEGQAPDFLEATLYDRDNAVIQAGYFDAHPSTAAPLNRINVWYKPFYYRHVETALRSGAFQESIPLKHFLHRFTRSIFWELEDMIPFSNHPLYRALWGWLGPPEVSLLKLAQGPVIRKASVYAHVVQASLHTAQAGRASGPADPPPVAASLPSSAARRRASCLCGASRRASPSSTTGSVPTRFSSSRCASSTTRPRRAARPACSPPARPRSSRARPPGCGSTSEPTASRARCAKVGSGTQRGASARWSTGRARLEAGRPSTLTSFARRPSCARCSTSRSLTRRASGTTASTRSQRCMTRSSPRRAYRTSPPSSPQSGPPPRRASPPAAGARAPPPPSSRPPAAAAAAAAPSGASCRTGRGRVRSRAKPSTTHSPPLCCYVCHASPPATVDSRTPFASGNGALLSSLFARWGDRWPSALCPLSAARALCPPN